MQNESLMSRLAHSAIMCLRGARSSSYQSAVSTDKMDLAIYEGQVPLQWTHILNSEPRCNYMPTL